MASDTSSVVVAAAVVAIITTLPPSSMTDDAVKRDDDNNSGDSPGALAQSSRPPFVAANANRSGRISACLADYDIDT